MKKHFLLPALLLVGLTTTLTSCKKNKDDAVNPSIEACKVDYATTSGDSTQITYDAGNRVVKEESFNNSDISQGYTIYTYSSNKIVEDEYEGGDLISKTEYYLNSNNNASYSVYVEDGNTDAADTTWYTYDSQKHNTRRVTVHTTPVVGNLAIRTRDTVWYTYSGANLSKVEEKVQDEDVQTTTYSYGSDDAKTQILAPGQEYSHVLGLFGNPSEKLPVSATMGAASVTYVYEFNDKGYVTRYKVMTGGVPQEDVRFRYKCDN